jgi:ATP-dependent Clp protease ATP-binding subunit ClpB
LTSNLGSEFLLDGINSDGEISEEARENVKNLLKRSFRPEFLNRLTDIVFYKPLTSKEVGSIVDIMLTLLKSRLSDKQISLEITNRAKNCIIDCGFDAVFGARPLKRYIESNVETMIARELIGGSLKAGDTITVDANDSGLFIAK